MRFPCFALTAVLAAATVHAQVPAGPEFQINSAATTSGVAPAVTTVPGGYVVVWQIGDGDAFGIVGRRFDNAGAPLGPEFLVNTVTSGNQFAARVAAAANGDFVVSWAREGSLYAYGIFARRFDARGQARGAEFRVDPERPGTQYPGALASDPNGTFVVVWPTSGADDSNYGLLGRRYDRAGTPLGADFLVNTYTTGSQGSPDVAFLSDGSFVVVWGGQGSSGGGVYARRFDSAGAPEGPDVELASGASSPQVAAGSNRGFVAIWSRFAPPLSFSVLGRWYGETGPIGAEVRLDTTDGVNGFLDVASDAFGGAWTIWNHTSGQQAAVFARHFLAPGQTAGAEFRVNAALGNPARGTAIASDPDGNVLAAWAGFTAPASGIFGQRFGGVLASALAVDTVGTPTSNGNGVLEGGETVDVRPSWRNVNGGPLTIDGLLAGGLEPFPHGHAITDAAAAYGNVPDGATRGCLDCYEVRLDPFPSGRPPGHLDVPTVESLVPPALALKHAWRLHVGDSFTDVPRTSAFYRFVETLMHRGVAAGCTPGSFCPQAAVTREQIALLALKAKEGPAYVPPACTTPRFSDVPASSPFCRWVEELARRGITGGCGASAYCPAAAVTREQMAVLVLRTLDPALDPPACTAPMFGDVPADSPFCRWIEELARRHVVSGCGGGNYCPGAATSREQMAVIVSVAFGLTLNAP